jgi:hypothetical protein
VNQGVAGSELTVTVDGKRVELPIGALDDPSKIGKDLADVLPAGYALRPYWPTLGRRRE